MEENLGKQIFETLKKAQRVLIALPRHLSADAFSAGLGLALFLEKMEKEVLLVSVSESPSELKFLPGREKLKSGIPKGRSLVVKLDTSKKQLEEISYQKNENRVDIFLKAKNGEMFSEGDLSFFEDKAPLDVIVTVGAVSLESLGKVFEDNPDLFFETVKINIDNQPGNEYFGSINLVDLVAVSLAEVVHTLMEEFESEFLDEDIATCLLAGIITQTNSFQHSRTSPAVFVKASRLIDLGGRQQEVIRHLYKTKPLSRLKLWGRALARLQINEARSLAYSVLGQEDFEKSGSDRQEVVFVLKDLAESLSASKAVAIIANPDSGEISLFLAVHPEVNLQQLSSGLDEISSLGAGPAQFKLFIAKFNNSSLEEVEKKLLTALEK